MRIPYWLVAVALACAALQARAQDEGLDLRPADQAARAWLATVDSGRYGESWEDAAALFKQAVPKLRWETTVQSVREPLGVVTSRKVRSMTYARVLPNVPEGEYVVIQFDTRFENRPLSVETVTPMREKDGSWKVSGYFIR
jgi:hypothetical protein